MLSRSPFSPARGQQIARRICASSFSSRQQSTAAEPIEAQISETDTATETPRKRRPRREVKPHPAPPNPPWPRLSSSTPSIRGAMTARSLTDNAIFVGRASGRLLEQATALARQVGADGEAHNLTLRLGVPRMPDVESYYTPIGPGVIAPWQPRGAPFTSLSQTSAAYMRFGGPKKLGIRMRVCTMHVIHPYSAKFLSSFEDIAPTRSSTQPFYNAANQGYSHGHETPEFTHSGVPHCMAEVVRRWYANKNRTDALWWQVNLTFNDNAGGVDLASVKTILRSKMHAKVQHAFKTALGRCGYSPSGWRLEDSAKGVKSKHAHLFGSVRLDAVMQRVLEASYEDLVDYITGLIPDIEAELGDRGKVVNGNLVFSAPTSRNQLQPTTQPKKRPMGKNHF